MMYARYAATRVNQARQVHGRLFVNSGGALSVGDVGKRRIRPPAGHVCPVSLFGRHTLGRGHRSASATEVDRPARGR